MLLATLWPEHGRPYPPSWCVACGERGMADAIRNLLLFIPLGFVAAPRFRRAAAALLGCAALSLLVETAQAWIPGRDPSIGDLLFNSVGAAIGVGLARTMRVWLRPHAREAGALSLAWAAVLWIAFAGTGLLLAPAPLHRAMIPSQVALIDAIFRGRAVLEGTADHVGLGPVHLDQLPSGAEPYVAFLHDGDDLVLSIRTRAVVKQLDGPVFRWRGALRGVPSGREVRVAAWLRGGGWCIRLPRRTRCDLGPTAGSGWGMIFYPDEIARRFGAVIDTAWIALLFLPLGCWLRRTPPSVAASVLAATAMAIVPVLSLLAPTPPGEWLGAALGLVLGIGVARIVGHLSSPADTAPAAEPPVRRDDEAPVAALASGDAGGEGGSRQDAG